MGSPRTVPSHPERPPPIRQAARAMTAGQRNLAAGLSAQLSRLARYDDESLVNPGWLSQRYLLGFGSYATARTAAVRVAWHEAGHAVAALAVGGSFSSASIRHGRDSAGRVHRIQDAGELGFVVDAAGQIAERLRDWTMLASDEHLRTWLPTWRADGGDARRFRAGVRTSFGGDEVAAWRHSEAVLTPLRLTVRHVARALLTHPRHLPCAVVTSLAVDAWPSAWTPPSVTPR